MSRLYVSIRPLCASFYPVKITRWDDGVTLQEVDPSASRLEIIAAAMRQLTADEHEQSRAGYGQPPIGLPLDDRLMQGQCLPYVPPMLRVPGELPIQVDPPALGTPAWDAYEEALHWMAAEMVGRPPAAGYPRVPEGRRAAS